MDVPSQEKPLAKILGAVRAEIAALAADADRLQDVIGHALPARVRRDHALMSDVQKLDAMSQRLHGLGTFVDVLTRTMPDDWAMEDGPAAALLTLADLARRLTGQAEPEACAPIHEADDYDLF